MSESGLKDGFFDTEDGLKLYYRIWNERGVGDYFIILHGKGEHISRYDEMAGFLADRSFKVAGFDYRGHGRSQGRPVHVDTFSELTDDVTYFIEFLRKNFGLCRKLYLFGHSLGGLIATLWAKAYPDLIKGLILSSPFFGLKLPSIVVGLNRLVSRFWPTFTYLNPIYPPYLTHDPTELKKYKADSYIKRRVTARMADEMIKTSNRVIAAEEWNVPYPFYLLMAAEEKIVNSETTKSFFSKVTAKKKELFVFPGFYHEIFREIDRGKFYDKMDTILLEIARS